MAVSGIGSFGAGSLVCVLRGGSLLHSVALESQLSMASRVERPRHVSGDIELD
jgi:hypothetical protein